MDASIDTIIKAINKNHYFLGDAWDLKLTPGSWPGPIIDTIIKAINKNHHFLGDAWDLKSTPGSSNRRIVGQTDAWKLNSTPGSST